MPEFTIKTTIEINASAADAWTVLGEGFGTWADWVSTAPRFRVRSPRA